MINLVLERLRGGREACYDSVACSSSSSLGPPVVEQFDCAGRNYLVSWQITGNASGRTPNGGCQWTTAVVFTSLRGACRHVVRPSLHPSPLPLPPIAPLPPSPLHLSLPLSPSPSSIRASPLLFIIACHIK